MVEAVAAGDEVDAAHSGEAGASQSAPRVQGWPAESHGWVLRPALEARQAGDKLRLGGKNGR